MKYKIYFNTVSKLLDIVTDYENGILEDYLKTEMLSELGRDSILEHIQNVRRNATQTIRGIGNLYGVEIDAEVTKIFDYYEACEEEQKNEGEALILPTEWFQKLVITWYDSLCEFRNQGKSENFLREGTID